MSFRMPNATLAEVALLVAPPLPGWRTVVHIQRHALLALTEVRWLMCRNESPGAYLAASSWLRDSTLTDPDLCEIERRCYRTYTDLKARALASEMEGTSA